MVRLLRLLFNIFYDRLNLILKGRIVELLLMNPQSENMEVSHSSKFVVFLTVKKLLSVRHLPYPYKIFLYSLQNTFSYQI